MGLVKTAGIVTKTTKYGETSLIVTVITKDFGKISAIAHNVRTNKSRMILGVQLFAYSEMVLYKGKNKKGLYSINEITVAESFSDIRMSLEKLAFASYFADIMNYVSTEDAPDEELLRLFLNALFALDRDLQPAEKIKMVFEWRMAYVAGYAPFTRQCGGCGKVDGLAYLSVADGTVFCDECGDERANTAKLSPVMLKIMDYICEADSKRIFSFDAGEETIRYLSRISEIYIRTQLEHEFGTLDYLKKVTAPQEEK